jgi:hypothetical protein
MEQLSFALELEILKIGLSAFAEISSYLPSFIRRESSSELESAPRAPPRRSSLVRGAVQPQTEPVLTSGQPFAVVEPPMVAPNLSFTFTSKKIGVELREETSGFFSFGISDITLNLHAGPDGSLALKGSIKGLEGVMPPDGSEWFGSGRWNKIISIPDSTDLVSFELRQHPKIPHYDVPLIAITANVAAIQIFYIQASIKRVVDYIFNLLSVAPDLLTTSTGTTATPETPASQPLLLLDITMASPVVRIPANPNSLGYINIDFGKLQVSNEFFNTNNPQVKYNKILIGVAKLMLSTNIEAGQALSTVTLLSLEGLSFGLFLPQVLPGAVASSLQQSPITGSLKLPKLHLAVKFDQMAFLMQVVSQNVLAGGLPQPPGSIATASDGPVPASPPVALDFEIGAIELDVDHALDGKLTIYTSAVTSSVRINSGETQVSAFLSSFGIRDVSSRGVKDIIKTGQSSNVLQLKLAVFDPRLKPECGMKCDVTLGIISLFVESTVIARLLGAASKVLEHLPAFPSAAVPTPTPEQSLTQSPIPSCASFSAAGIMDLPEPSVTEMPAMRLSVHCETVEVIVKNEEQKLLTLSLGQISLRMDSWETQVMKMSGSLSQLFCRIEDNSEWQTSSRWSYLLAAKNTEQKVAEFGFSTYPNYGGSGVALSVVDATVNTLTVCLVCKPLFSILESFSKVSDELKVALQGMPQLPQPDTTKSGADFLKLSVDVAVSVVIPENPQTPSNVTASIEKVTVTNLFKMRDPGTLSNMIAIEAKNVVLSTYYKNSQMADYQYQSLLNLSQITANLVIPAGKSEIAQPDLSGKVHIEDIQIVVPSDVISAILRIYSGNISELVEKGIELGKAQSVSSTAVATQATQAPKFVANFEFSLGDLFFGVLHSRGNLGCGLKNLSCGLSIDGSETKLKLGVQCLFIQYITEVSVADSASMALAWPPPQHATTKAKKSSFSCGVHECRLDLTVDNKLDMTATVDNITMTYKEDQESTTILTLRNTSGVPGGSRLTVNVNSRPSSEVPSGAEVDCIVDFNDLFFLFTVDRVVVGKLALVGLEFLAFTKKVADIAIENVTPATIAPVEQAPVGAATGERWDLKEPGS